MKEKRLIRVAKFFSVVFSPMTLTFWTITALLAYNYLKFLSWGYRMPLMAYLVLLVTVFSFTILIPRISINLFRRLASLSRWQMSHRRYRHIQYFMTMMSYWICVLLMRNMHAPVYLHGIVMAAFATQLVCALLNLRWKVSVYMAGMGGLLGIVVAFALVFNFNPVWAVCILLLLSGALGTSRMILCQHSLSQIIVGYLVGLACSIYFVMIY